MPGLYGFTGNANVVVSDTPGLYIGSGAVSVLNSAGQLLTVLDNNGNVNFYLDPATGYQTVYANFVGTIPSSYGNTQVAAYLPTYTGSLNNSSSIITLNANLGAFETYANATFTTSSYGNSNVAAYLPTDSNIKAIWGNIQTINANLGAYEIANNANVGTIYIHLNTLDANVGSYENITNANLGTATNNLTTLFANASSQATSINTINANLGAFETYANATFGTSSYGNTQAAAWIKIDPTITALQANIGAFEIYSNANASSQATSINTINANVGAFETYANLTFGTSNYGNSNVAAYLTGSITVGNIKSTSGYFWANGVNYSSTVPGTYTNSNVTNLLSGGTYGGDINAPTGVVTAAAINSTGQVTAATYLQATNGLYSTGAITEAYSDGIVVDYTSGNGRISVGTADAVTFYAGGPGNTPTAVLYPTGNLVLPGSLTMTNGVFWANGTAYSSGSGSSYGNTQVAAYLPTDPTIYGIQANVGAYETWANIAITSAYFSGNLVGNTLTASGTQRIFANANPLSPQYFRGGSYFGNASASAYSGPISYSGGVANSSGIGALQVQSNITMQSAYGTTRTVYGQAVVAQLFGTTANTMNNNDRIRALSGVAEVYPQGLTWGTMTSASQNVLTIGGTNGIVNAVGTGNVSALIGMIGVAYVAPDQGSLNAQYVTGSYNQVGYNLSNATNRTASNITYARLYAGSINSGSQANLTITNSVGLHTYPYWHANVSAATNRWTILNEDTTSTIQTSGNIVISASTGTPKSGFMQFGVYPNASLPTTGVAGQVIAISDPSNTAVNPAGSLAYWDTTNNRWSYVATNTVVP